MSFDDLFRRGRLNKTLQRTAAGMAVPQASADSGNMKRVEVRLGAGGDVGKSGKLSQSSIKMRQDQPMAYPDHGSIQNHKAR